MSFNFLVTYNYKSTTYKSWKPLKVLNKWANRHTYLPLDLVRIALGVFLFLKGMYFMTHSEMLAQLFIPFQNMVGGILISFGLLTRWAILLQLPILIGAVIINFVGEMNTTNLILALSTLLICAFFLVYESGKNSSYYYFKTQKLIATNYRF